MRGNRLQKIVSGSPNPSGNGTTVYVYDADDRITGESGPDGTVVHTYDLDGRETTVAGQTATYDSEDHLVSVGSTTSYAYDADGSRVQAVTAAGTTNYLVDASLPFAGVAEERSTSGALVARYDYGDDLIRMDRGGAASYYVFDGLGSTRTLTNAAGVATDGYAYDAFGSPVASSGSTVNPFLFDGQQFDGGTGLYYLRARYYNQSSGRFLSQDPYEGDDEDPISLHRYLYASNDAVDRYDPSGQDDTIAEVSTASGISTTLGGLVNGVASQALLAVGRATTYIIENQLQIEFYALLSAGAIDFINKSTQALLDNVEPVQYEGGSPGQWVEGQVGANATDYEIIDDFRDGNATSIKTNSQNMERCIGKIQKEARTLGNRQSPFQPQKSAPSSVNPIPMSSVKSRTLLMVIPETSADFLENPAFIQAIEDVHNETDTIIHVVPLRGWRTGTP